MAVSCLPPTDIGCDLALPTARVKYSNLASRDRSMLQVVHQRYLLTQTASQLTPWILLEHQALLLPGEVVRP